ncbi:MAG TPA: hypothetical protein VK211_05680 [Kamptonema sp.]|nr:hypothetical protein [Kamptonema sp.]
MRTSQFCQYNPIGSYIHTFGKFEIANRRKQVLALSDGKAANEKSSGWEEILTLLHAKANRYQDQSAIAPSRQQAQQPQTVSFLKKIALSASLEVESEKLNSQEIQQKSIQPHLP